jgi:hypothetical protein
MRSICLGVGFCPPPIGVYISPPILGLPETAGIGCTALNDIQHDNTACAVASALLEGRVEKRNQVGGFN